MEPQTSAYPNFRRVETELAGRKLIIETGKLALHATGSVTVRYGDIVVLAAATMSFEPRAGIDFFPLLVDYEEKYYASGKIKGSRFIKREGRPSDNAVLTSRLIDRPIRPLFPKGFYNDVQIVTSVLSSDQEVDPATTAMVAASAALSITGMPFQGPIAAVRIGRVNGEFVVNPTYKQEEEGDLDLIVAGTKDAIMMVEAGAKEVSEETVVEAIKLAHEQIKKLVALQEELQKLVTIETIEFVIKKPGEEQVKNEAGEELKMSVREAITKEITDPVLDEIIFKASKEETEEALIVLHEQVMEKLKAYPNCTFGVVKAIVDELLKKRVRHVILNESRRPGGRGLKEIRTISCEAGILPRTHGSALFQRGETQVLTVTTIGSKGAGQIIEEMDADYTKHYMHHYNFPPYSVGEVRPLRSAGRREVGHGFLAERALQPMIPNWEEFPYTLRLVSEVLGSNGSTSMGSVCGSTLSLMDAGVKITRPVSGIAMGLMTDDKGNYKILSDIKDIEDFGGDMDFKVAGTEKGITALQMDIKIAGLSFDILSEALAQAKEGRAHILQEMLKVLPQVRSEMSQYAPRAVTIMIKPDQIRSVIGSGGKVINEIIDTTGVEIDIDDDGTVTVTSNNPAGMQEAVDWIKRLTYEFTIGETFEGKVVRVITDRNTGSEIGVIVERFPGKDGMVHISELDNRRVGKISEVCKLGDTMKVKVVDVDSERGRVSLSRRALLTPANG